MQVKLIWLITLLLAVLVIVIVIVGRHRER